MWEMSGWMREYGERTCSLLVGVAVPGPVLSHDVDVVQRDVVEVRVGEDGRGGQAVGCI